MTTRQKEEVLIVGAGPTGLCAALTLAQRGIKARIIDERHEPITTSNALGIQPRTLELWEEMGLINEALSEGHTLNGVTISTSSKHLSEISFNELPTSYPYILALPQAKTERLLAKHLSEHGVTVERGVTLETLSESSEGIEVVCNGISQTYSWVIGCDGAKSDVRSAVNIPFKGYELPQHFIMADLQIDWDQSPNQGHVFYSNDGPLVFFPLDEKGFGRLIIDVSSDKGLKNTTQPTFQDFKDLMGKRCAIKAALHDPSWISNFWIHCRVADTYKKGNVFLAGDAAHLHSPFGGQGLNIGVQDAHFLASLLADVLEGKQSKESLENYEKIRRPIGESVVRRTALATKIATTQSRIFQSLRNLLIPCLLRFPWIHRKATMTISQLKSV